MDLFLFFIRKPFFSGRVITLSPSFHPHSLMSFCSLQVGCSRFSRCCYLIGDLSSSSR